MTSVTDDFVSLHTHTHSSRFDGLGTEDQFCKAIKEMGQSAVAFTEHGNVSGLYSAHLATQKHGLKLIPALEAYLAEDAEARGLTDDEKKAIRKAAGDKEAAKAEIKAEQALRGERDHITIWALNDEGLSSLYQLSSWSWMDGYYRKPRVDMKRLKLFNRGLAVSTGCAGGVVASPLREGKFDTAMDRMEQLADIFGDRLYTEIMPHIPYECPSLARRLAKIADSYGSKLLATQDAHYVSREDAKAHEVLLCINTRDRMSVPPCGPGCTEGRFAFDSHDYYLRDRKGMREALSKVPGLSPQQIEAALDNTVEFANRVTAKMHRSDLADDLVKKGLLAKPGQYLAVPDLPEGISSYDKWVLNLCRDGCRKRFQCGLADLPAEYKERLIVEIGRICELGFASYFVLVQDIRNWANSKDIEAGPGRGSAAGSLVCYLLGITDIDPIKWSLSFDRFLPDGRQDMPDIDADYDMNRREEIIQYLQGRYGEEKVCLIGSANTFGGKAALNAVGRSYEVPNWEIRPVTGLVVTAIEEESQDDESLGDVLDNTEAGQEFKKKYPEVCEAARRIEGQTASAGVHAAGVVVCSEPLSRIVPLESRERVWNGKKIRFPTLAWDMRGADAAGLVKVDILGLKTLSWLYQTRKTIERLTGKSFSWLDVPYEDRETMDLLLSNHFVGVFQYDTPSSRRLCSGFSFEKGYSDISLMTALNRPGPTKSGLADLFLERVVDPSKIPEMPDEIREVVQDTSGCIIYQEQVIEIAKRYAGYTAKEADAFRKKIGKKLGLSDEEEKFVTQAVARGGDPNFARAMFADIKEFASYCFNRAHAFSYGRLSFLTAWAKTHWPGPFLAGALANESQPEKQLRLVFEARRYGIKVSSPEINTSEGAFSYSPTGEIVGSALDIKGIGAASSDQLSSLRPYYSLVDFAQRNKEAGRGVTAKTFELLAKANSFRALWPSQSALLQDPKKIWAGLLKGEDPSEYEERMTPEEQTKMICSVYPLHVPDEGATIFEIEERDCAKRLDRAMYAIGDPQIENLEAGLVFGRLSVSKMFLDANGRSARIELLGPNGEEMTCRVDHDPCDRYYTSALAKAGHHVLALCRFWKGRASLDAAWRADEVLNPSYSGMDAILRYMMDRRGSSPRDPGKMARRVDVGSMFTMDGILVSGTEFTNERTGKSWARLGVLSRDGYATVVAFAEAYSRSPNLDVGAILKVKVTVSERRSLVVEDWISVDGISCSKELDEGGEEWH